LKQLFFILIISIYTFGNSHINIATVPWRNSDVLEKMYQPLIKLIEDKTSKKVNFLITNNYKELSERIASKNVDIAIFGANSYVDAKELLGDKIVYLGTSMQPLDHYNSLIITHKDSQIYTLRDLVGKNFAFTDFGSTSGYVYPNLMLYKAGIKDTKKYFKTITMLKKHYRVYNAIAKKSIDAGGATASIYNDAIKRNGDIYRVLKRSMPIPQDPIVVSTHMGTKMISKLKKIFKEANKSIYFKKYNTDLKGISIRNDSYYDIVREAKAFKNNNK
jgi:phosphonate transport system substrate-binding protein